MPIEKQEWQGRLVGGDDQWYDLTVHQNNEAAPKVSHRDDWAWAAAEAFVTGMADDWELQDADVITVELTAPDSRCYQIEVACQKTWNCVPLNVKKV